MPPIPGKGAARCDPYESPIGLILCPGVTKAAPEPMILDVVLSPKNQINLDCKDNSRHFVILIQREGTADGSGVFEGVEVVEYGMHDLTRGESGKASGYFEATTTDGDAAYFWWRLRAFFIAGPDGTAEVINNGSWELTGGTGQFATMRGVGTMLLEFVSKTDRRFVLTGDISPAP